MTWVCRRRKTPTSSAAFLYFKSFFNCDAMFLRILISAAMPLARGLVFGPRCHYRASTLGCGAFLGQGGIFLANVPFLMGCVASSLTAMSRLARILGSRDCDVRLLRNMVAMPLRALRAVGPTGPLTRFNCDAVQAKSPHAV